jgi:hypothetical protein
MNEGQLPPVSASNSTCERQMTPKQMTSVETVTNAAGVYGAGIICPGELWNVIAAVLENEQPHDVLGNCLPGIQHLLRRAYTDRPGSVAAESSAVRTAIKTWGEGEPPSPPQS